jgi:hypothetical protein
MKFLLPLTLLIGTAAEAQTQQNCGPREVVIERLKDRYGETRRWFGLTARGLPLEMYTSEEKGTWSLMSVNLNGEMCMISSGQSSHIFPQGDPV